MWTACRLNYGRPGDNENQFIVHARGRMYLRNGCRNRVQQGGGRRPDIIGWANRCQEKHIKPFRTEGVEPTPAPQELSIWGPAKALEPLGFRSKGEGGYQQTQMEAKERARLEAFYEKLWLEGVGL